MTSAHSTVAFQVASTQELTELTIFWGSIRFEPWTAASHSHVPSALPPLILFILFFLNLPLGGGQERPGGPEEAAQGRPHPH
jgi:hypothetical protein